MPTTALKSIIAPVFACALLVACSSTVNGSGVARQPSSRPSATESSQPTDTAGPTDSAGATDAPSSPAPIAVPPPAQCPSASCQTVATASLGSGFVIMLRSGVPADGSAGASIIELTLNGIPVYWYAADGNTPANLTCRAGVPVPNCIVIDYVGAHGSQATVWALSDGTVHRGDSVTVGTPSTFGRDLNGDGSVDVIGLQSNYDPDYVTGKLQWQTWTSDDRYLKSTGCTPLKATAGVRPTAPATGKCVAS